MRILIFTLFFSMLGVTALGQQAPQYSHYIFNQFQLNPAVAGMGQCLDLRFGFRNQWAGFDDGPKTQFGSVHTRIGGERKKNSSWHGVGLKFETDQAARFSQSLVQLAYAYHFKMNREMTGSLGLFFGFNQYKVDLSNAIVFESNDPIFNDVNQQKLLFPEISPGFWMHNESFFLGVSVKHAVSNTILKEEGTGKLIQHLNLTSGKAFELNKTVNLIPSLRVGYVVGAPIAIDVNAMVDFNRILALGVGYRNSDSVIGLLKLNFLNYFTLGYAYDFTLSDMSKISTSTHEVMLGITACPGKVTGKHNPCAAYN